MRIRRNINCLRAEELHDLREAFAGIYNLPDDHPHSFATIAGLHGSPGTSYCIHVNQGFLSWHRAYLLELENALRTIRCNVTLPFWNWSSGNTTGVPAACRNPTYVNRDGDTVHNPLYSGPIPAVLGGGFTSRGPNIDTTSFGALAQMAQNALTQTVWGDFVPQLNSVHGLVHGTVGGNMGGVPTAGFDPIFWLHHANVDRLWANWHTLHGVNMPASEANTSLEPFTRPYTNTWHLGGDFQHTTDWDYQYRNWCFILPDWDLVFERPVAIPIDDWAFDARRIGVAINAPMMPRETMEIRVFVNNEKASIRTKPEPEAGYVGSIGIFGMGDVKMFPRKLPPFRTTLGITQSLRDRIKKKDKEFHLRLVPVSPDGKGCSPDFLKHLSPDLEVD